MRNPVTAIILLLAALAAVYLLFTVVFPWVDRTFVTDPVLGSAGRVLPAAAPPL